MGRHSQKGTTSKKKLKSSTRFKHRTLEIMLNVNEELEKQLGTDSSTDTSENVIEINTLPKETTKNTLDKNEQNNVILRDNNDENKGNNEISSTTEVPIVNQIEIIEIVHNEDDVTSNSRDELNQENDKKTVNRSKSNIKNGKRNKKISLPNLPNCTITRMNPERNEVIQLDDDNDDEREIEKPQIKKAKIEKSEEAVESNSMIMFEDLNDEPINQDSAIKNFFESMAQTVCTFPPLWAAEAKLKVGQIVGEMELRLFAKRMILKKKK